MKQHGPTHRFLLAPRWSALALGLFVLSVGVGVAALMSRPGDDPTTIRLEARRAADAGQWELADSWLKRFSDLTTDDWLLRAIISYNLKSLSDAEESLRHIPADGPLAAQALLWQGRIELARFRARPMEDSLRRALKLDPKLAEARRLLVYLYGTQDRRQDLLEQFAALAEIGPLTFGLINHWCITHQDIFNEPSKLKADLEKFVAADPGDRLSRLALAMNERKLGHLDRAGEILAPLPDTDADALACRAEVAFDRADYPAGESWLAKGPTQHARLERLRGRLASRQGDRASALKHYRLSDSLEPNHWETNYGLSQALPPDDPATLELRDRRRAQRELEEMLTTIAQNKAPKTELCRKLGALCEEAAYLPEAQSWYRLAIKMDPLDKPSQQALARLKSSER